MPIRVEVKSSDSALKAKRRATADRVIERFGAQLPDSDLLCFFDDEEWQALKDEVGRSNRGFYTPLNNFTLKGNGDWPPCLRGCIFVWDEGSLRVKRVFDHLIYLHGSTCACDTALVMTFAHELQHFVQYSTVHDEWAANRLIRNLPAKLGLKCTDVPIEQDARIASKGFAQDLCGVDVVRQHIDRKISEAEVKGDLNDRDDWKFIRDLDPSGSYDLVQETRLIFQKRLRHCRPFFEEILREWENDPDSERINLDVLLNGAAEAAV